MNASLIFEALCVPAAARIDRRIPKALLAERGARTAADKRYISDGIEELRWIAALKPVTISVPECRDEYREYLEIAVLRLTLRTTAKAARLVELVHRAVPYPVLLLTQQGDVTGLSLAHKRWSHGQLGAVVVDGDMTAIQWDDSRDAPHAALFLESLGLSRQPRASLWLLYQGWIDTVLALLAARFTGTFQLSASSDEAAARRQSLELCVRLDQETARVRAAALKEKQVARRVALNLELQRIQAAHATAIEKL